MKSLLALPVEISGNPGSSPGKTFMFLFKSFFCTILNFLASEFVFCSSSCHGVGWGSLARSAKLG